MNLEVAIRAAVVEALQSPEALEALRQGLALARPAAEPAIEGDADRAYTVGRVAELSGYTPETIVGHITGGNLRAYKPKGCREWRVRREDYRAWLTDSKDGEDPEARDPNEVARRMLAGRALTIITHSVICNTQWPERRPTRSRCL
jgi:excisionase family DNA binding protein